MAELSIIVPIYNVGEYLSECIKSILSQTFKDFELILVNDGSTDDSEAICYDYATKDSRIKVITKENGGVSSARNVGIDFSTGSLITFVDPDDLLEPNMYAILINSLKDSKADLSVSRIRTINYQMNKTSVSSIFGKGNSLIDRRVIKECLIPAIIMDKTYSLIPVFNKVYRRSILYDNNIRFDETMHFGEDARLNIAILTKIQNLIYVDKPLYNYFIHKRESLVQQFREDMYEYILNNKNFFIKLCVKYNLYNSIEPVKKKFMNITLNYIGNVVERELPKDIKIHIINGILNHVEFMEDLKKYKCPTIYRVAIKYLCILKNENMLITFIKFKNKLQEQYRKRINPDGQYVR